MGGTECAQGLPGVGEEGVAGVALVNYGWVAGVEVVHLIIVGEVAWLLVKRIAVDLLM
jgi:hypothetical protein